MLLVTVKVHHFPGPQIGGHGFHIAWHWLVFARWMACYNIYFFLARIILKEHY